MHPMLRLTIGSCGFALCFAAALPVILDKLPPMLGKIASALLPIGITAAVLAVTLRRAPSGVQKINLVPFWSYRQWRAQDVRWQIMMNVALFVPLGASLRSIRLHPILIFLLGAGLSVLIEYTQYRYGMGLCEVDDVINNTLGTMIGCGVCCGSYRLLALWKDRSSK